MATKWMNFRCEASFQSPSVYGGTGLGVEPPPALTEGKVRCPVCWKEVKLLPRIHVVGRRIPNHNIDHDMVVIKQSAFDAARQALQEKNHD